MGSRARARAREEMRLREAQAHAEGLGEPILDAADFWGESASAVHHAMRAPNEPETRVRTPEVQPPRVRRARGRRVPRVLRLRVPRAPERYARAPERYARAPDLRVGWRGAVVAVAVAAIAVVAVIGVDEGSSSHPGGTTQARVQESIASHQRSTAGTDRSRVPAERTAAAQPVPERSLSERPSVRRLARRRSHVSRDAARPGTRSSNVTTGHVSVVTRTVTTPRSTTIPLPTPVATGSTPSATTARDGATDSSGGGSDGSTSPPSGPLGPGAASGCDPKCS
jgi:hypothetical protein